MNSLFTFGGAMALFWLSTQIVNTWNDGFLGMVILVSFFGMLFATIEQAVEDSEAQIIGVVGRIGRRRGR